MVNRIEGVEQLTSVLSALQASEANKILISCMKTGGKEAAKYYKGVVPKKQFKKLVTYKVKQTKKLVYCNVGLFDKNIRLVDIGYPDTKGNNKKLWSIAYWLNYGTLQRRDKSHKFAQPIKNKSKNRVGGVRPNNWQDSAQPEVAKVYQEAFTKIAKEKFEKLYGK